jgi:hypothetical protein
MTEHATYHIRYGDQEADVDRAIVWLILEIWRAGLHTVNSCEDNQPSGYVWVQFPVADDANAFIQAVIHPAPSDDDLNTRALAEHDLRGNWLYHVMPLGLNLDGEPGDAPLFEPALVTLAVSVRFPRGDLDEVVRRLRIYNQQRDAAKAEFSPSARDRLLDEDDVLALTCRGRVAR